MAAVNLRRMAASESKVTARPAEASVLPRPASCRQFAWPRLAGCPDRGRRLFQSVGRTATPTAMFGEGLLAAYGVSDVLVVTIGIVVDT